MADGPAVSNQQQINSGKTCCPFAAQKPCDVDQLKVKVKFNAPPKKEGDGEVMERELSTSVIQRKPVRTVRSGRAIIEVKNYPEVSLHINRQLAAYDFIIDSFADFPLPKTAKDVKDLVTGDGKRLAKLKAAISAEAQFYGLHCEPQTHGKVVLKSLSGQDKPTSTVTSIHVDTKQNKIPPQEFAALRFPMLDDAWVDTSVDNEVGGGESGATGISYIFDFIASIFAAQSPKEVEVIAYACGKRPKEAPLPKNTELRALVRIFRKDKWTLGLKLPALGEFKREASGTRQLLTGATEGKITNEGRFGDNSFKTERGTSREANGRNVTTSSRESWDGDKGSSMSVTRTNYGGAIDKVQSQTQYSDRAGSAGTVYVRDGHLIGKSPRQMVEERMKTTTGFDLVIARNGMELPIKKTFEKVKKAVETFAKTLAEVQELFKKAPQIGWKITFEVSALAGQIVLEFGPEPQALTAGGRYYPVNYVCSGKLKLEILNLKMDVSFGLDAQVLDTGLVLKIGGGVQIKVEIETDLNLDLITKPVKEIEVKGVCGGRLEVVGYVSLVGKTVAGANLTLTAALEFADGKLTIDVVKPSFKLTGKLRTTPVCVEGWIQVPWWWDKKLEKTELLPGRDIQTFQ